MTGKQVPETSPTETAEPSIQNPTSKPQNFEDGQFASKREPLEEVTEQSPTETSQPSIQNPKSKIQNLEDGQFATNREPLTGGTEQVPETSPTETAEPSIQNPKSKIQNSATTIVVLHPSVSGAEVSAADAALQAQPP